MIDPKNALAGLPASLRNELITSYSDIVRNYVERRWEPSELNGGKFAEVVYSIVEGAVAGSFPNQAHKPRNMKDACQSLENKALNSSLVGDKSLRVFIPRALVFLYDVRNHRGVGHVGGDVNPNSMDALAVLSLASWVMAELVRVFHGVSTQAAENTVEALVERRTPLIWQAEASIKRVLVANMTTKDQVLLLLHHSIGWVSVLDLFRWVEYSNSTVFRKRVLTGLHEGRYIEFDVAGDRAKISPIGVEDVERRLAINSSLNAS